jgi:hypothetical protein
MLIVFLSACAWTIPAGFLEDVLNARVVHQPSVWKGAQVSFLFIAPIEETAKLLAVWVAVYRSPHFRDPLQGIIFSAAAGMGFVTVENAVYLVSLGHGAFWHRVAFATPAHVMFSSMWGYSMGLARFQKDRELVTIGKGLALAVLFHGAYNTVVAANEWLVAVHTDLVFIALIPLMLIMAWVMNNRIRKFRRSYPYERVGKGALVSCSICGAYTPESEPECRRCGSELPFPEPDARRYCSACRALLDPCDTACGRCGEPVRPSPYCSAVGDKEENGIHEDSPACT